MRIKYVHFTDTKKLAAKQTNLASFLKSQDEDVKNPAASMNVPIHNGKSNAY